MNKRSQSIYVYNILVITGFLACVFLVLLLLGSYMIADDVIKSNQKSSALINVSGNQRMLSQSIANLSNSLISYPTEREVLREKLRKTSDLMGKAQLSLLNGDQSMGLFGNPSTQIKQMMFESPHLLNKRVSDYLEAARALSNMTGDELTTMNPQLSYIRANSEALLESLDELTAQYQRENEVGIIDLRRQQKIIMVSQISVILLLTLLIFLPLVYRVRREILKSVMLEKKVSSIIENMQDGLVTIDDEGIVQSFNPSAERIFDYKAEEVIGQNVSMLMPEPYSSRHDSYLKRYLDNGVNNIIGSRREVVGKRRDDSTFPLDLTMNEIHVNNTHQFFGMVRDITERKRAEENLILAKNTAEEASQAKDAFLATMSHEIRTPLAGMLGMLEVLSLSSLNHEQEATLKAAWDSARSLLRIVNDILDWSKIKDGKLALSPQSTSIPLLLQEVVDTYSRVASSKNVGLWQHADSRLSAAHIVDPLRLSQILNNFVSNALKFTEQGEVELCAELLEQLESGERIRFFVKDTGIGIAKDVQPNLFKRYRQESADTARQYGGTGLGLSICQCLAELLDGQVDLVSEPGLGAIFSVTVILPISAEPGEKIPTLMSVVEQKKIQPLFDKSEEAPRILAVDDHPINRDLLARQIALLGLRAETAENGQDALSKWKTGRFDLVITDCHMPEMDGYEFARAVRLVEAKERRSRMPIIAWTANARSEEGEFCRDAGMDELLVKPSDLATLKAMLIKWLSIVDVDVDERQTTTLPENVDRQNESPIDYAELSKVIPDSHEHAQVLHEFKIHISNDRDQLIELLKQGDQANVMSTAHRMKGSCRMVGAIGMASACATIEQRAREEDMDSARVEMTELNEAFKRFEAHLTELPAS